MCIQTIKGIYRPIQKSVYLLNLYDGKIKLGSNVGSYCSLRGMIFIIAYCTMEMNFGFDRISSCYKQGGNRSLTLSVSFWFLKLRMWVVQHKHDCLFVNFKQYNNTKQKYEQFRRPSPELLFSHQKLVSWVWNYEFPVSISYTCSFI